VFLCHWNVHDAGDDNQSEFKISVDEDTADDDGTCHTEWYNDYLEKKGLGCLIVHTASYLGISEGRAAFARLRELVAKEKAKM
jgi:hypothetical protein